MRELEKIAPDNYTNTNDNQIDTSHTGKHCEYTKNIGNQMQEEKIVGRQNSLLKVEPPPLISSLMRKQEPTLGSR